MLNVLVRMPNWLGDLVMASAFTRALQSAYPGSRIDIIVKKGLEGLGPQIPGASRVHVFNKADHPGLMGAWRFGKSLRPYQYDLFFCLPNSFSSALMGYATASKQRIGYRKEGRNFLLTRSFPIPSGQHRVLTYLNLLEQFTGNKTQTPAVTFTHEQTQRKGILVNINSEAQSRRLTETKAISLINELRAATDEKITLLGGPSEREFVGRVYQQLENKENIESVAGQTTLPALAGLMAGAGAMLSTDSGPAHLGNALGAPVTVLFGAGNENHTAPFNAQNCEVIRLNELSCEPCERNECKRFDKPECLERLSNRHIIETLLKFMQHV